VTEKKTGEKEDKEEEDCCTRKSIRKNIDPIMTPPPKKGVVLRRVRR